MFLKSFMFLVAIYSTYGEPPYCTQYTGTAGPNDPLLPDLPDQFQATIEANIVNKGYTITAYEYFDSPGQKAAVRAKKNNTDQISLFDYTNNQVFYITGKTCTVKNITADKTADVLFGKLSSNGIPHILNTAGALHFLKSSGQKYLGLDTVRGIRVDHWQSCLSWPLLRANFTLDYYFTVKNWQDAIAYPQIPVRAYVKGVQMEVTGALSAVEHYYDYIDFRTSIDDLTVFEPPVGVVCAGRSSLPVPTVKNFFHAKLEMFNAGKTHIYENDFWYDRTARIVRYDQRLKAPLAGIETDTPVTFIDDYNYGIQYIQDKVSGTCHIQPISTTDFTSAVNHTATGIDYLWYKLTMKGPREILAIDANFTYIGKRTVRGLVCNVFSGIRPYGDSVWAVYEYYVLAGGYSMYPDDIPEASNSVPIQLIISNDTLGIKFIQTITTFSEVRPDITLFDISACYPDKSSVSFTVKLQGNYKTGLRDGIIREAHNKLSAVMGVSPLRIQKVLFNYDNSFVYISAKLLDISPILKQFTLVANYTSKTLNDAAFPASVVSSPAQCAAFCLSNKNFTCNSFDFCADTNHICRLSRTHTVGKSSQSQGVSCSHYSRTVDGRNNAEVTFESAYQSLLSAVYGGQLQLQTFLPYLSNPIWYDYEYQLVRYDVLDNGVPVSKIHDYNSGIAYVINKNTQQCQLSPLTNSSFDVQAPTVKQRNQTGYVLKLKNPIQLFDLSENFVYTGQKTIRGILCDSYENVGEFDFGNGLTPAVLQFYFMAQTWNELSESSGQAVDTQPVGLIVTSTDSMSTIVYDIIDFNEQHPDLSNFNIQPCFPADKHRDILIMFYQTYHPTLDTNLALFTKTVQMQLAALTGVSPLRFQNPQVTYDGPNTLYTATMVEQSPSLLDFTKISQTVGVYSSDGTYVNIGSDLQCAEICRNISGFTCFSFDYCATTKDCQLSRRHTPDGNLLKTSAICDHYSSETLTHFNRIKKRAIHIRDVPTATWIRYSPVGVDDCATKCRTHASFDCESFTYCANVGGCYLSDLHPAENATAFEDSPICNLYSRKYTDRYSVYQGTVVNHGNTRTLQNVGTADICARECSREINSTCKSFDFCANTNMCYLSDDRTLNISSAPVTGSSICLHYTRKYLFDFTKTPNSHVSSGQSITFTNTTVENCAKLCIDNYESSCKSFVFCGHSTCNIYSIHPGPVEQQIGGNAVCDLYTKHVSRTTYTQTAPAVSQPSKMGYSSGAMAAVAFGTFIPAMVLGAAIIYFMKTKKLVDRKHEHEMKIIEHEVINSDKTVDT